MVDVLEIVKFILLKLYMENFMIPSYYFQIEVITIGREVFPLQTVGRGIFIL